MIGVQTLFFLAAALMLIDAFGYSLAAVGPIQRATTTADQYWKRRLKLNLLLANQGLYFVGLAALLGSYFVHTQPEASKAIRDPLPSGLLLHGVDSSLVHTARLATGPSESNSRGFDPDGLGEAVSRRDWRQPIERETTRGTNLERSLCAREVR